MLKEDPHIKLMTGYMLNDFTVTQISNQKEKNKFADDSSKAIKHLERYEYTYLDLK